MPYREDRDAAVARADSLQVDVERAERELAATKAKLADAERTRELLAAELARRPAPSAMPSPGALPSPGLHPLTPRAVVALIACGATLLALFAISRSHSRRDAAIREADAARAILEKQLAAGPCILHTDPEGAAVYGVLDKEEVQLGNTPLLVSMPPAGYPPKLVVRGDGFAPYPVSLWDGCPQTVVLAR